MKWKIAVTGLVGVIAGVYLMNLNTTGTTPKVSIYDTPLSSAEVVYDDVKHILDSRCVVCHACYDAPCQLKFGAFEGIARGASKKPVYKGDRLLADNLSRLFIDADSVSEWRHKDFFPVLNEGDRTPEQNLSNSLLVKLLNQKQAFPLDEGKKLSASFDLDINREWQCATLDEYDDYLAAYPQWGMPYALPALSSDEHAALVDWVAHGAATTPESPVPVADKKAIAEWEAFLNQDGLKHQLAARYLYEHFFIAHIYFGEANGQQPAFYRLFRSATPPGEPVDIIASRRPFSDPGVERVYYRFVSVRETLVDKNHMPFRFDTARRAQYQAWFIDAPYEVDSLPGYKPEVASNPFITFEAIPIGARYRFMLSEAQYTIMQFIKGPVCRGQIALNVINDHFWVFFAEPSLEILEHEAAFMSMARDKITLPAEAESNALPTNWIAYAEQEKRYAKARTKYLNDTLNKSLPLDLSLVWDGDGQNDNVALTVFRHFDAASVVKGLVGDKPQTAWIITYPLFERIHYLLVAGYDVYGNVGHQLNSRMYMDFLRMEGEFNFLSLLPKNTRNSVWDEWYRGIVSPVEEYVASANLLSGDTAVSYTTDDPLNELYARLSTHVSAARSHAHDIERGFTTPAFLEAAHSLNTLQGKQVSLLPQASFVRVTDDVSGEMHFYTLLRNNAYSNISHIIAEDARRLPDEDTLTLGYGFISSHPNAFFDVSVQQFEAFAQQITRLTNQADIDALADRFGVRRTSDRFWEYSDALHDYYRTRAPVKFGYFDFNRLENL
ncbi:fatty acid cis/trans isomerase [Alteromonas sp. CYL-A6]|uniref:fatty acid cis/trans isomerase n=1 Tax=Alteromonas nitratireducens TaxID=3390813 RepID=UPI0034B0CA87